MAHVLLSRLLPVLLAVLAGCAAPPAARKSEACLARQMSGRRGSGMPDPYGPLSVLSPQSYVHGARSQLS